MRFRKPSQGYGPLFHHPGIDVSGKWITGLIEKISSLSCDFGVTSTRLINGINVSIRKGILDDPKDHLGEEISKFIVCSYMEKNMVKYLKTGGNITYQPVVNLVLDTIDKDYTSIVNKDAVESIITILNHPHFSGCNSIEDIKDRLSTVEKLNNRMTDSNEDESVDEDEGEDEDVIYKECIGDGKPVAERNIFLD